MEIEEGSHGFGLSLPRSNRLIWANLPEGLVEQVLLKLPPPSLLRFRAVCKYWNQLLRSKYFLERYDAVIQFKGPWFLSIIPWTLTGYVYDFSTCKLQRQIDLEGMAKFSRYREILSDGGVICFDIDSETSETNVLKLSSTTVWNPLTSSKRHINCPFDLPEIKLCAFRVDRKRSLYKVIFFAKDFWSLFRQGYDCLLIYDSEEDSWCRTKNSPVPLNVDKRRMILDGCIYFIMYPELGSQGDMEWKTIYYDLAKDAWNSCVISPPHHKSWGMERMLHVYQNCAYMISISKETSTIYVDEIKIGSGQCHTTGIIRKSDFESVLKNKLWDFSLHSMKACKNTIMIFVKECPMVHPYTEVCYCPELSLVVLYDRDTHKCSSRMEEPVRLVDGYTSVGFEPSLDMVA